MTSAAETPSSLWMSTGMPRPLSVDRHRFVGVNGDHHSVAVTGQGLIDRVVHHLEDHVMQAAAVVGVSDIHSRAFADGVESL